MVHLSLSLSLLWFHASLSLLIDVYTSLISLSLSLTSLFSLWQASLLYVEHTRHTPALVWVYGRGTHTRELSLRTSRLSTPAAFYRTIFLRTRARSHMVCTTGILPLVLRWRVSLSSLSVRAYTTRPHKLARLCRNTLSCLDRGYTAATSSSGFTPHTFTAGYYGVSEPLHLSLAPSPHPTHTLPRGKALSHFSLSLSPEPTTTHSFYHRHFLKLTADLSSLIHLSVHHLPSGWPLSLLLPQLGHFVCTHMHLSASSHTCHSCAFHFAHFSPLTSLSLSS